MTLNTEKIRNEFPILQRKVNGKPLVYLDNAATTQKPSVVIESEKEYYEQHNANVHRGIHALSEEASQAYDQSREIVAQFIGCKAEEIVYTKNATESLNLAAYSLSQSLKPGDEVLLTEMEHHSNLVPWQLLSQQRNFTVKHIPVTSEGLLDMEKAKSLVSKKTKIVSATQCSNMLGTVNDVKALGKLAHDNGALFVVDGAQSVPHFRVNVKELNCDLLAFSGHKMCGPTGIGVLFGKKELLEKMPPFLGGGDMIAEVWLDRATWNAVPIKFEAGTPNIAGAIGLGVAAKYLQSIGMENIFQHEQSLSKYAYDQLKSMGGITVYGPTPEKKSGVLSFNVEKVHAHDVGSVLDQHGVAVRVGHHCAQPLMRKLNINGSVRASFYLYNTKQEVDQLVEALKKTKQLLS